MADLAKWKAVINFGMPFTFEPNEGEARTMVAFKTPRTDIKDKERMPAEELIAHYEKTGLHVKHVIDLTNTAKYYDPSTLLPALHHKQSIVG